MSNFEQFLKSKILYIFTRVPRDIDKKEKRGLLTMTVSGFIKCAQKMVQQGLRMNGEIKHTLKNGKSLKYKAEFDGDCQIFKLKTKTSDVSYYIDAENPKNISKDILFNSSNTMAERIGLTSTWYNRGELCARFGDNLWIEGNIKKMKAIFQKAQDMAKSGINKEEIIKTLEELA